MTPGRQTTEYRLTASALWVSVPAFVFGVYHGGTLGLVIVGGASFVAGISVAAYALGRSYLKASAEANKAPTSRGVI